MEGNWPLGAVEAGENKDKQREGEREKETEE